MPKTKPPKTEINQEEKNKINQKEKTIVEEKLQEINKKLEKKEAPLTFEDIEFIVQYTKKHINNEEILNSILNILDKDIQLRNQNAEIDCIEKLYEYNEILREEFRLKKPKQDDKKALIREKLRAIIMDNYRKNYNYIGKEFIGNQITYEEHKERIDILDEKTFSLLLKVKVITQS
jgi:hypothetical protein